MFYLDGILLRKYLDEIKPNVVNLKLKKINQEDKQNIHFHFGKTILTFSQNNNFPIVYINNDSLKNTNSITTPFLITLKNTILGGILTDITSYNYDRIVILKFKRLNYLGDLLNYKFIFEITGRNTNLILLDSADKIITAIKTFSIDQNEKRAILKNFYYKYPIFKTKLNPYEVNESKFNEIIDSSFLINECFGIGKKSQSHISTDFKNFKDYLNSPILPIINFDNGKIAYASLYDFKNKNLQNENVKIFDSATDLINYYINIQQISGAFLNLKKNIEKIVTKKIENLKTIISKIIKDLDHLENFEIFKQKADILSANIYTLKKKKNLILYDFYNNCDIEIFLNLKFSIQENIKKYYDKYSKSKRSINFLNERMANLQSEIKYIETIKFSISIAKNIEDLSVIEEELKINKYITIKKNQNKNKKKKNYDNFVLNKFMDYIILTGKNNLQNEKLTFKTANRFDIWMHAKGVPGSHTIIVSKQNEIIPDEVIKMAAEITAYYSKNRHELRVTVDYTEKKHVKKAKNYRPCFVNYNNFKSITVIPYIDKNELT